MKCKPPTSQTPKLDLLNLRAESEVNLSFLDINRTCTYIQTMTGLGCRAVLWAAGGVYASGVGHWYPGVLASSSLCIFTAMYYSYSPFWAMIGGVCLCQCNKNENEIMMEVVIGWRLSATVICVTKYMQIS